MECCEEYEKSAGMRRRTFMGAAAATTTGLVTTRLLGESVLQASYGAPSGGNVLVVVSFRGGIDGLGVVVPHGDPGYYAARPLIGVPKNQLWGSDAMFGFHPKLSPLKWLWDSGQMAAVHAVGLPVPDRSHFTATEAIEDADPGSSLRQGWVNRMVGLNANQHAVDAVSLGVSTVPTMIEGPALTIATRTLDDVRLAGADRNDEWGQRRVTSLGTTWAGASGPLADGWRAASQAVSTISKVSAASYTPAASYPTSWPGHEMAGPLKEAARLIKADIGVEVITIDVGGWDMHTDYGPLAWGRMQSMLGGFAAAMDAFMRDLGTLRSRTTVATISEFGRRVAENGSRGLDHGWGNAMLLFGSGLRGTRVHGRWPNLVDGGQRDDDLQVTTDYRQVLGEILHRRFPAKDVSRIFPGIAYRPLGVMA